MNERYAKILLLLVMGWFLGYFHHYQAVKPEMVGLKLEAIQLNSQLTDANMMLGTAKPVNVKTTAYSNDPGSINVAKWRDNKTAINTPARRGVVAADWRIFPPGTRLYIPGYGEAVVEDRGGAVKGYHLDLFVDSVKEARKWGVQEIPVYVIERAASKT